MPLITDQREFDGSEEEKRISLATFRGFDPNADSVLKAVRQMLSDRHSQSRIVLPDGFDIKRYGRIRQSSALQRPVDLVALFGLDRTDPSHVNSPQDENEVSAAAEAARWIPHHMTALQSSLRGMLISLGSPIAEIPHRDVEGAKLLDPSASRPAEHLGNVRTAIGLLARDMKQAGAQYPAEEALSVFRMLHDALLDESLAAYENEARQEGLDCPEETAQGNYRNLVDRVDFMLGHEEACRKGDPDERMPEPSGKMKFVRNKATGEWGEERVPLDPNGERKAAYSDFRQILEKRRQKATGEHRPRHSSLDSLLEERRTDRKATER